MSYDYLSEIFPGETACLKIVFLLKIIGETS